MEPRSKSSVLLEADAILHKPNFTREDSARIESLFQFADRLTTDGPIGLREPLPKYPEFENYLKNGKQALDRERRMQVTQELRNMGLTGSEGGYLAPAPFASRVETVMQATDPLFQVSSLFETSTGGSVFYPLVTDEAESAAVVAESSPSDQNKDVVFAALSFGACPMWRSGLIRVPVELMQDSLFDMQSLLAGVFGIRFARGCGAAFTATLLDPAGTPPGALVGVTAASQTAITANEIYDLVDSLDSAYSESADAGFLMRKSTFITLSKLVGTSGNFVFPPQRDSAGRPLLLEYPVYFSGSMGGLTAGSKPIAFGSLGRMVRRQVRNSLIVRTLIERFAEYSQCGFEAYLRCDSGLLRTTEVSPIKTLAMHA